MPDLVDVPYLRALTEKLHKDRLITCCTTCDHFNPGIEFCVKYRTRPPARVIATGCESWDDTSRF